MWLVNKTFLNMLTIEVIVKMLAFQNTFALQVIEHIKVRSFGIQK